MSEMKQEGPTYSSAMKAISTVTMISSKIWVLTATSLPRRMPDGTILPYYDFGNNHLLPYQGSTMSNGESSLMLFLYWLVEIEDTQSPSLVVIDEFDAFYHIKLSRKLMQILQKRVSGQVILTTHNGTLISNEMLRPDLYFFLKNNRIQAFDKIAGKEIREAHNLRRMFDAGVFDPE
ncbi:MAG: AAA family ATPase [Sphaerochaetaceae bacterium]|nr:AAA family ATPase [Sphaerochaetaceae bacterium]